MHIAGAFSNIMHANMRGADGAIVVRSGDYCANLQGEGEYVVPAGIFVIGVVVVAGGGGGAEGRGGEPGEVAQATYMVRPGDRFKFKVGKGGAPGTLPGQHGLAGEDSYFQEL